MFINNELRDEIFKNSILHGFWDNNRTYIELIENIYNEFEETLEELRNYKPTEIYYKDNKLCGAPTELADIIIFILDYFGGSNPQIDIDEEFLLKPNKYYKNNDWYTLKRNTDPYKYFLEIMEAASNHLSISILNYTLHNNSEFIGDDNKSYSVSHELHEVIKLVLEFCDIYGIDINNELIRKINYNSNRPKDYRKIGTFEFLETNPDIIMANSLNNGYGTYKMVDEIISTNSGINDEIRRKRGLREELENNRRK